MRCVARYRCASMSDNPGSPRPSISASAACRAATKRGMVRAVFDSVAPRYDLMNDLMSLGMHRVWKQIFVDGLRSAARGISCWIWPAAPATSASAGCARGGGPVLLTDINPSMLAVGARPRAERGFAGEASLAGRRCRAPAAAGSLRRPRLDRLRPAQLHRQGGGAAEARRVLKPGGRFLCLEFSRVQVAALAPLYDAWSFQVLPRSGAASRRTRTATAISPRASAPSPTRRRWPA